MANKTPGIVAPSDLMEQIMNLVGVGPHNLEAHAAAGAASADVPADAGTDGMSAPQSKSDTKTADQQTQVKGGAVGNVTQAIANKGQLIPATLGQVIPGKSGGAGLTGQDLMGAAKMLASIFGA